MISTAIAPRAARAVWFQSLIGILVDFNFSIPEGHWFSISFQSLIGILVDFNARGEYRHINLS
ncbi:hypothetical protein, partial [Fischerella thermalis]|uniref:hypothetical protein n=1 Tax=Fischerella thermalis TaxID=372787 RepID=UPI001CA52F59